MQFGDEHRNLSDSLTGLLNGPTIDDTKQAHKLARDFIGGFPSVNLDVKEMAGLEQAIQMERIIVSAEETAAICAKAYADDTGFSPLDAGHVAWQLRTTRKRKPKSGLLSRALRNEA